MNTKYLKDLKKKLEKWIPVHLSNLLISLKLKKGSESYQRFIILGRSRTGSNFLKGLLNSHTDVVCWGELFRVWENKFPNGDRDVMKYLFSKVYRKYSEKVKAVGFKIFYYHSHKGNNERLWDYIKENKDIKVIHITRDNMLNTVLSRHKAGLTDKWANTKNTNEEVLKFELSYEECLKDFEWTEGFEKEYREILSDHSVYEIVYEDLAKDTQNQMNNIMDFLNLEKQSLVPNTYKQRKETLRDSISNYDELKEKFKGSRWERFFEE